MVVALNKGTSRGVVSSNGQTEWRNKWSKCTILPNDGISMQRGSILTLAKLEGERKLWHHGLPEDGVDALASPLSVIFNLAIGQQNVIPAKWKKAKVTPPWYAVKAIPWFKNYFFGKKAVHVHWFSIFCMKSLSFLLLECHRGPSKDLCCSLYRSMTYHVV